MSKIVGIDFGTTNSCCAVMINGEPTVIPNLDGELQTPSVVSFFPNGEFVVGNEAKRRAFTHPLNTISRIKKLLGFKYSKIEKLKDNFSFTIVQGEHDSILIQVDETKYLVQEIVSYIIKDLVISAEDYLNEPVTEVILTIPVYFNNYQIQALQEAAHFAGLKIRRLVRESTAAAMYVGYKIKDIDNTILIYDLGGGSLDISIIETGQGVFEVKSTSGNFNLGGYDFDKRIADWMLNYFFKQEKLDFFENSIITSRFEEAAEKAKIALTDQEEVEVNLPFISFNGIIKDFSVKISKQIVNDLCQELIETSIHHVEEAIKKLTIYGWSKTQLDEIVLIGSASKMPLIQEKLSLLFQKNVQKGEHSELAVGLGAAIQGGILMGEVNDCLLLDALPFSLDVEIEKQKINLLDYDTTIPTIKIVEIELIEKDYLEIKITQQYSHLFDDYIELDQFYWKKEKEEPISLGVEIEANGIITFFISKVNLEPTQDYDRRRISFRENIIFSKKIELELKFNEFEIQKIKEKQLLYQQRKKLSFDLQRKIFQATKLVSSTNEQIDLYQDFVGKEYVNEITILKDKLNLMIKNNLFDGVDELIRNLNHKWQIVSQMLYLSGLKIEDIKKAKLLRTLDVLKDKIALGEIYDAMNTLNKQLSEQDYPKICNDLYLLLFDFSNNEKRKSLNLITEEDYSLKNSQIAYSFIEIITEIKQNTAN